MVERKLGRGLDGLMRAVTRQPMPEMAVQSVPATNLPVSLLDPNPDQPRQTIKPTDLEHLKSSIQEHGVIQPIVVRKNGDRYQVIAGERRLRAAQGLGLSEVPVIVREASDEEMLELALVENLQREDLDPIEKAVSFKAYLARSGRTQDAAATRLGLDRSTISNMIRLLELPEEVQLMVRSGLVAMGHARAILAVEDNKRRVEIAEKVAREGLSVRQVEQIVSGSSTFRKKVFKAKPKTPDVRELEGRLREALGTKVSVEEGVKSGTGKIIIEFYGHDDLERILDRLTR